MYITTNEVRIKLQRNPFMQKLGQLIFQISFYAPYAEYRRT